MAALASSPRLLLCLLALLGVAAADGDWRKGRATFYGLDGWSIHKGQCGFGYQYKNLGTGWDVAAVSDSSPEFAGSCGRCYEVRCQARSQVLDGYGNKYDRSRACKAGSDSVVVRTVDSCPCHYPSNAYSNKRWCCNDNAGTQGTHFDLSIWAFEKIADVHGGMAGIEYRRVPCDYKPSNPAPDGPTKMPHSESPAALGYPGSPYAPNNVDRVYQQELVQRFDGPGKKQGAVTAVKGWKPAEGQSTTTLEKVLGEQGGQGSSSSSSSSTTTDASDNGCTDNAPEGSTCQQQKDKKQCSQPWLLSGNYCRATCGHCKLAAKQSSSGGGKDKSNNGPNKSSTSNNSKSSSSSSSHKTDAKGKSKSGSGCCCSLSHQRSN